MLLYKLIKDGVEKNRWYSSSGLDENHWEPSFGKKERWVISKFDVEDNEYVPDEDISQALESRESQDLFGNPCTEYKFAAEFEVQIEDLGDSLAWEELRRTRDLLLSNCDFTQLADAPLSSQEKSDWATYRQALRDLPANTVDPNNPSWPTKP